MKSTKSERSLVQEMYAASSFFLSLCASCKTRSFRYIHRYGVYGTLQLRRETLDSTTRSSKSAMASLTKAAFSMVSPFRLLCSHCRQRFLHTTSQKRLLTTQNQKISASFDERLLSGLEELEKPSSDAGFVKDASTALGVMNSRFGNWSKLSSPDPPSEKESALSQFKKGLGAEPPPHHLHVYATRHNCHMTLSDGKRQPLISVSSGNIGFRKAARGSYDAAYQLGAYVMGRIQQQGLLKEIRALEIILRDFGPGREAFTKILMGNEGKLVRGTVVRVMDATRLKFGGTRSKKPRRL